jgi:Domain of unknown function (DUF5069)
MPDDKKIFALDLTKRPPRSPRLRLGGYTLLPRMLDKGRAEIAGTNVEYHFNGPLDQRILDFIGIDANALREQLATGKATARFCNGSLRMLGTSVRRGK